MHLRFYVSIFKKISQSPGYNQQICRQCCLPPLSLKISLRDTSFHISLISLGFYLSPECLLNFLTCIFHHVRENFFSLWCSHSHKMHWIYTFLFMPQSTTQNSRLNFLKICFPQDERDGGNYNLLYQNSIRKYEDDLEH